MPSNDLVVIDEVAGDLQAQILRGLLEAQGIPVMLSEESAGKVYGFSIPAMGAVQLIVRAEHSEAARKVLEAYYDGELEGVELEGTDALEGTEESERE
jgi:hypothetical protein